MPVSQNDDGRPSRALVLAAREWKARIVALSSQRFRLRYGFWRPLLSVLGAGPAFSGVHLDEENMRIRMGWGFRATVPLAAIQSVRRSANNWSGIGVHGWAGWWLVNGSVAGIVRIEIDPPARARVLGVPVRLRILEASLEDPDGLVSALEGAPSRHRWRRVRRAPTADGSVRRSSRTDPPRSVR